MLCPNCGSNLSDGATFCSRCGTRMNPPSHHAATPYNFTKWAKEEGRAGVFLKICAAVNLLLSFIMGIVVSDSEIFNYIDGKFWTFLVVLMIGAIFSAIVYGLSELVRDAAILRQIWIDKQRDAK